MDKLDFSDYKIILGSGSPRRQEFLRNLDVTFEIRLLEIEELYPSELKAHEITDYLAKLKADAFESMLSEKELLITSDTIVWLDDKAVGKPKDYEDAFQILRSLSNKIHEVITSVCFKTVNQIEIFNETTKVTFGELSDQSIRYYLDTYKPFDKAGAYGIQDWIGLIGIEKIEGSYTNVVGLPTHRVYDFLKKNNFDVR